jgi:integrase
VAKRHLTKNVTEYQDRHGKWRYRFRKRGLPEYHFRHPPGTPEFLAELDAARNGRSEKPARFPAGTVDALCVAFYGSQGWQGMQPSSQRTYRGIIERWRKSHGSKPIARLEARHVDRWLAEMADRPAAANNLRKALSRLFRYAVKMGWLDRNPVEATDPYRIDSDGFHAWTEEEIARFQKRWPLGTRERLAMELLLWTALRRSDLVALGRQHRRDGCFYLRHGKNRADTVLPVASDVAAAIDAMEGRHARHLTYLVTEFGKPFTANGFGNWFRTRCDQAGLPGCSAHGLRKAIARRLAEASATSNQGRAVTGHRTDKMFAHYSRSANQAALAGEALANLEVKFAKSKD